MSLERALAEEAELEKVMFSQESDPSEETTPIDPNVDTFDLDEEVEESSTEPEVSDPQESKEEKKTKQSWKQRFINFKASSDKTTYNLRKENSQHIQTILDQRKEIDRLAAIIADLRAKEKDIWSDVITQEDISLMGTEAVDVVKKTTKRATESVVEPLMEEVRALKAAAAEKARKESESARQREYNSFIADLGALVPDFGTLNLDPKFEQYMMGTDESTGERRLEVFRRAEDYLDANRVADFFLEYKASIPKSKREVLEEKVTVTGTSTGSVPSKRIPETFTIAEVKKFYDDEARGLYRHKQKEANELEARITKAYIEGRITD